MNGRAYVIGVHWLSLALAASVQATTISDNFNDNSINTTLWRKERLGGVNIKERNHRLEVSANGQTGEMSGAGIAARDWAIDWQHNFSVSFTYKVDLPAPPSDRATGIAIAFVLNGAATIEDCAGLVVGIVRMPDGLYLVWGLVDQLEVVDFDYKRIYQKTGTVKIKWSRSADRLTITAAGKTMKIYGLYAEQGAIYGDVPLVVGLAGATVLGDMSYPGTKVFFDNFVFTGTTRPQEPLIPVEMPQDRGASLGAPVLTPDPRDGAVVPAEQ